MEEINKKVKIYIRLYTEANYPIRDIAKQYRTSVSTVYNAMVAAGFTEFRSKHSRTSHTRMSIPRTNDRTPHLLYFWRNSVRSPAEDLSS